MKNKINLSDLSTLPTKNIGKEKAAFKTLGLTEKLAEIQNKLYAQRKYSVLIVIQGMDTSGKDSTVRSVFSGINPAGCNVKSFKVPTEEEALHHFLWRVSRECPQKGMIEIFNRSHYEDVIMPLVNNTLNEKEILNRCKAINAFEKGLIDNNNIVLKFFLNISHKEQVIRLNERKINPQKRWKYQEEDVEDISKHKKYKKAYELVFEKCSEAVEWQIIPADKKWYKNYCVLDYIVNTLEKYSIDYPEIKLKSLINNKSESTINK